MSTEQENTLRAGTNTGNRQNRHMWVAFTLLLGINLLNYIDRQVLSAVLPKIEFDSDIFSPNDPNLKTKLGLLTTAFMITYMLVSPIFGWLGDRYSRWKLVGIGVIIWSLASGGSGWATSFGLLLLSRCLVGFGEGAYGPAAPSILSDLFPIERRRSILTWFYAAIPVGSALGFVIGGKIAETSWGWRGAFEAVVIPGVLLGLSCLFFRDHFRQRTVHKHDLKDYFRTIGVVWRIPSFFYCSIGMVCTTFVLGGVAVWTPYFIFERQATFLISKESIYHLEELKNTNDQSIIPEEIIKRLREMESPDTLSYQGFRSEIASKFSEKELKLYQSRFQEYLTEPGSVTLGGINFIFGGIVVVSGLMATLLGGYVSGRLQSKVRGAYFKVSGWSTLLALPFFLGLIYMPFPLAWICIFIAVFGLFMNTGPANTILANVTDPAIRATAFAINILVIHLFGDAISPTLIGFIADQSSLSIALTFVSILILLAGVLWLQGAKFLDRDTQIILEIETKQKED